MSGIANWQQMWGRCGSNRRVSEVTQHRVHTQQTIGPFQGSKLGLEGQLASCCAHLQDVGNMAAV